MAGKNLALLAVLALQTSSLAVRVVPTQPEAAVHAFLGAKAGTRTVPALQPHDTFDEDYPIDNSALTPSQLRYQAQANYAKAVAEMKEEEAEAAAAEERAKTALARHKAAVEAAKNAAAAKAAAKAAAARAAEAVEAAKNQVKKAEANSGSSESDVDSAKAKLAGEEASLKKAENAVADAEAGQAAAEKTLEEKAKQLRDVNQKLQELGKEKGAAEDAIRGASSSVSAAEGKEDRRSRDAQVADHALERAEAVANAEAEQFANAEAAEAKAAANLKEAQDSLAKNTKSKAELNGAIESSKDSYRAAHEKYLKEQEELEKARAVVAEKKAALAKHGVMIGFAAPKAAVGGLAMLLAAVASLC